MSYIATHPDTQTALLWLELSTTDHKSVFALSDNKAIVVGSSPRAHFRVDRPGVRPVQFHFEREAGTVYVAPACPGDLCVNSVPVRDRCALPDQALIEFCGTGLTARIIGERPNDSSVSEDLQTTEHVLSYQLEQALDCDTVRVMVPRWNSLERSRTTSTAQSAVPLSEMDAVTTALARRPAATNSLDPHADAVTTAYVPQPAAPSSRAPDTERGAAPITERMPTRPAEMTASPMQGPLNEAALFEHTVVMERPRRGAPAAPIEAPVGAAQPAAQLEHTLAIPRPVAPQHVMAPAAVVSAPPAEAALQKAASPLALALEPEAEAVALETRIHGTMVIPGVEQPASKEPSATSDPCPKTPKTDVRPAPNVETPGPQPRFEPATVDTRVHAEAPNGLSRSLNEATTAFEAVRPVRAAEPQPAESPTPAGQASPTAEQPTTGKDTLVTRLGTLVKARPLPVVMGALAVALLIGTGTATIVKALDPPPARGATASAKTRLSTSTAVPPVERTAPTPTTSAAATARVPAALPSATPLTDRTKPKKGQAVDPELVLAVGYVSAGRYADAAGAYMRLSSRADAEVFQTLAVLLERASLPDCKPTANRDPGCPEVLR